MNLLINVLVLLSLISTDTPAPDQQHIDAFLAAYKEARTSRNIERIKELYCFDDISPEKQAAILASWKKKPSFGGNGEKITISKVAYLRVNDYYSRPDIVQYYSEPKRAASRKAMLERANLTVTGYVEIKYHFLSDGGGDASPVGMAADGTLKLVAFK